MTAGLPGSGIGGLFYLIGAVAMPFRELARRLGGRPRRGALVASQAVLALSIIAALWATGWVLDWLIYGAAAGSGKRASSLANAYARIPHVFRMTSLLVSLGTLAGVIGVTRVLAFIHREEHRPAADNRARGSLRRVACWLVGLLLLAACTPHTLRAQSNAPTDALEDARASARSGRRDQAITQYESWLASHPDDARAWRELGIERMRADRYRSAASALERSLELHPDESVEHRLAYVRARTRLALLPQVIGTRDSDGSGSLRVMLGAEQRLGDRSRGRLNGTRLTFDGDANTMTANEFGGSLHWRPLHALQLEAGLGALYSTELGTSSFFVNGLRRGRGVLASTSTRTTELTGRLRLRWTGPANGALIDARLTRTPAAASATLVRNRVVLEETRVLVETPGRLRVRALGSIAQLPSIFDQNRRTRAGGGVVFRATPLIELSAQFQRDGFDRPTTAGYFAPAEVQVGEFGAYAEFYGAHDIMWALDLGAGAQRYADHSNPLGAWKPALRGWTQMALPLGRAAELSLEAEYYQSSAGGTVTATPNWRFYSGALSLRWHL